MESGYIFIYNNIFPTLLAISEQEQSKGLMNEAWPPPIMSFIFKSAKINHFWMRSTPSPLDIVFCNAGKVSQICYGEPNSTTMIGDNIPSDLIIEMPHGTALASNIQLGHNVGLIKPEPTELKKIIAEKYRFNF